MWVDGGESLSACVGGMSYAHVYVHAHACMHVSDDAIMGFPRKFPMGAAT